MKRETTFWLDSGLVLDGIRVHKIVVSSNTERTYATIHGPLANRYSNSREYRSKNYNIRNTKYPPMPVWMANLIRWRF